jgi:hypothetical protein
MAEFLAELFGGIIKTKSGFCNSKLKASKALRFGIILASLILW